MYDVCSGLYAFYVEVAIFVRYYIGAVLQVYAHVRHAGDFAKGREVTGGKMNRLYAVESTYTITGAAADHRLALRSGRIGEFAMVLADEVDALLAGGNQEKTRITEPVAGFARARS